MLKSGVIMDVVAAVHAKIVADARGCAVMRLERLTADIRADGEVARMFDTVLIYKIMESVAVPVQTKWRIGHYEEAETLDANGVDDIDEFEVHTLADEAGNSVKHNYKGPARSGCSRLCEGLSRVGV